MKLFRPRMADEYRAVSQLPWQRVGHLWMVGGVGVVVGGGGGGGGVRCLCAYAPSGW